MIEPLSTSESVAKSKQGVKLNTEKRNLRLTEVPFIEHIATGKDLRVDPAKVRAIAKMPAQTGKAGVQRLLVLVQYLSKFLSPSSDITKPLRKLTQNDVEWTSETAKKNYSLEEEVTLQCDASQFG